MDVTTSNIIMEIFSPEQCDIIGIYEGFNFFTRDEKGNKTVDIEKVKAEFEKIKAMNEPEAQANKTKQLIQAIAGCIVYVAGLSGLGIAAGTLNPVMILITLLVTIVGFMMLIKLPPASKAEYYQHLDAELNKTIGKLSREYNKIKGKYPDDAKELNAKIEELSKQREKVIAEIKKTSY